MCKGHFKPVSSQVRFPEMEKEILADWQKNDTFKKSLEKTKDNEHFVFYDGPPFATGLPHYGHLLAGTLKDIVPRFWTMKGFHVDRRFGWDTHGLPVENEMEKEFAISGKKQIEQMGLHLFNEACRSIVLRYTSQWKEVVERMGRWVDFENGYRTMDPEFMESIWWVFKQVWDKDLIYEGYRVQPYCPRCSTPLSNFEVNEGYKDKKDVSVTVKMPLVDEPNTSILVWTTTPWTLPSNVVLAAGAEIDYVKIKDGEEFFIMAKARVSAYYKNPEDYTIVEEFKGKDLAGKRYTPLFDFFADRSDKFFQVTTAEYVSTEDGTGVVHIAPAFGEDDFLVGKAMGLPIVCPVDAEGNFTDEVTGFEGRYIHEVNGDIIEAIKQSGRLVHRATIEHRYPHCYRCDTPLLYKAMDTWFMKIEPLKKNMLENNQQIHWVPDHLQNGRFGKGLEGAPDWNIARNRYWGTPIPIWRCDCGHDECVGSLEDLHTLVGNGNADAGRAVHAQTAQAVRDIIKTGAKETFEKFNIDPIWAERASSTDISDIDLHPHVVNRLELLCPKCKKVMNRTPEVLDCWFESGSMPYAQNHYPFENKELFEATFPANFIAEGIDQTRGWFYTLTVLASALFNKPAFKNVVVNGIILAEDGNKMSKRLKNYAPPQEIMEKIGADAIRLFLINSPAVRAEDLRFSEAGVLEMARSVLIPFWNAYSFLVTYINEDGWTPNGVTVPNSDNDLDKWIISLFNDTVKQVNDEMEQYNLYKVVPAIVEFIDNLTNWYIRRSRLRLMVQFSKVMAPFLPFVTDAVYKNLVCSVDKEAPESVHLCDFPQWQVELADEDAVVRMELIRKAVGVGRLLRSRYTIKTRQPLADATIIVRDDHKRELIKELSYLITDELNVKEVRFEKNEETVLHVTAKADFKKLGKVYGKEMKDAAAIIAQFTSEDIRALENGETREIMGNAVKFDDIILYREKKEGVEVETDGEITLALNTEITKSLLAEGYAREFVNRIQTHRKESDYAVSDRIALEVFCDMELRDALGEFEELIKSQTLTSSLLWDAQIPDPVKTNVDRFEVHFTSVKA